MPIFTTSSGRGPLFLTSPPSRALLSVAAYVPPTPTFVLKEDASFVLLEDGTSKVQLDG